MGLDKAGLQLDGGAIVGCAVNIAQQHPDIAQIVVRFGMVGIELDGSAIGIGRLGIFPLQAENIGQMGLRLAQVRPCRQHLTQGLFGLAIFALTHLCQRAIQADFGHVWPQRQYLPIDGFGLGQAPRLMEHESLAQLGVQRGDSLRHVAPFGRHSSGEGWSRPPPGARFVDSRSATRKDCQKSCRGAACADGAGA